MEQTEKIRNAAVPNTKKKVRSCLGLAGYCLQFIPNFATIAEPLTELTKKGVLDPLNWTEIEQNEFDTLKNALCTERILRNPEISLPLVLQADSSDYGRRAVLFQEFEDGEHPIIFISRKFSKAELNYSTIEKESLAIVFKKLDYYVYGRRFKIMTDHNS